MVGHYRKIGTASIPAAQSVTPAVIVTNNHIIMNEWGKRWVVRNAKKIVYLNIHYYQWMTKII